MEIYTVKSITEADYGCEDTGRESPMALVKLLGCSEIKEERNIEISEADIEARGIAEGVKVCITESGEILKYEPGRINKRRH